MKIAFYAPLKAPDHPVPSGDRQMARLLMAALRLAGHEVALASDLRAYLPDPEDAGALDRLSAAALAERQRLASTWAAGGAPDLWFCYHPYYKSPDLIGPPLCRDFGLPWVSAEASLSARRGQGIWRRTQAAVAEAIAGAAINFGMTARDRAGLATMVPNARIATLPPFCEAPMAPPAVTRDEGLLVTVAMMRPGDKMESYRALAAALALLPTTRWHLAVAGDGPLAAQVRALFPPGQVDWLGALPAEGVAALLARGGIYVWPGCGEAYGLAYLEAQALGLPVVAWAAAGVPEVVRHGETGLLSVPGDVTALARDIGRLLADHGLRRQMGSAARQVVLAHHGMAAASRTLDQGLQQIRGPRA